MDLKLNAALAKLQTRDQPAAARESAASTITAGSTITSGSAEAATSAPESVVVRDKPLKFSAELKEKLAGGIHGPGVEGSAEPFVKIDPIFYKLDNQRAGDVINPQMKSAVETMKGIKSA